MPRRLRIKFRGNFSLPLAPGAFTTSGKAVTLVPGFVAAESSERVQLGMSETGWLWASAGSRALFMEWGAPSTTNIPGGTWLDANGALNGPANRVTSPTLPIGATQCILDISTIPGDVYLKGIEPGSRWGAWTVTIDGVTKEAWWLAQSNEQTGVAMGAGASNLGSPFIVKNQSNGTLLTMTWTTPLNATRIITANHAIGPLIPTYPLPSSPGGSAPNIHELDMVDFATFTAFYSTGQSTGGSDFLTHSKGSFGIDPDNGVRYARFCIPGAVPGPSSKRGLAVWKELPPGLTECWFQYMTYMESSVWDGINPLEGIKFGFSPTEEVPWNGPDSHHFAWRPLHGGKSAANRDVFRFAELREMGNLSDTNTLKNVCWRANKWYLFDTYIKLNTIDSGTGLGNFDGEGRLYVNKNLVHNLTGIRWRNSQFAPGGHERNILAHYGNYFHGGNEYDPLADMFYRIARVRASTNEIAVPSELIAGFPTWRQGRTVGVVAEIAGTGGAGVIPVNAHALHWNGFAICDDGRIAGTAVGGHNGSTDTNGQNKSFMIDLSQNVPGPWVVVHEGTGAANSIDYLSIDAWYSGTKPYRAHYDADAGDVPIRPPCQTYDNLQYVPGQHCNDGHERIFNIGMRSPRSANGGVNSRRQVDGFRLTDFQWDEPEADTTPYPFVGNGTKWADIPPRNGFTTSNGNESLEPNCCRDPRNGKIYWAAVNSLFIFNPQVTTNQWSTGITANGVTGIYTHAGSGWNGQQEIGMLVDINRERLVLMDTKLIGGVLTPRLAYFPLAGGAIAFTNITGITQGTRSRLINFQCGFTHDRDNDLYHLLLSGSGSSSIDTWYEINPLTGAASVRYESAAGEGGPGRCMTSFAWNDALGGVVYARGGNTSALAEEKTILFLPTRATA
jgi:hypothetical protein